MQKIQPANALYIKLGREGSYEKECLVEKGTVRVGWIEIPHDLCIARDWDKVNKILLGVYNGNQSVATNQKNQLRKFYESDTNILWVTFYDNRLYWCFADPAITVFPDGSRERQAIGGWRNCDINGVTLDENRLSGSLLSVQGYQGTICEVREFDYLVRKINAEASLDEQKAIEARAALIPCLEAIIHDLHWKEFELLMDLIFRQAGWQRLSVLGSVQRGIDLELLAPINQEKYRVQVKGLAGIEAYNGFLGIATNNQGYAQHYLVVNKPDKALKKVVSNTLVRLWFADDVARLAVNYGLADWVIAKAK